MLNKSVEIMRHELSLVLFSGMGFVFRDPVMGYPIYQGFAPLDHEELNPFNQEV